MWFPRSGDLFLEEQHGVLSYLFDSRENPGEKMLSQSEWKLFVCIQIVLNVINKPMHFFGVILCFQH